MRDLLHSFKYENKRLLGKFFAKLMFEALLRAGVDYKHYRLTFVPMSYVRYWQRPYNQARVLAHEISQWIKEPVTDLLAKEPRPRQVDLSGRQRRENMKDAFSTKYPFLDKKLIIVDDVVTTGATMTSIAQILKQEGARSILALTVC